MWSGQSTFVPQPSGGGGGGRSEASGSWEPLPPPPWLRGSENRGQRDPHSQATFRLGRLGDTPAWLDVMVVVPRGCFELEARLAAEGAAELLAPRVPGLRGGTTQTGHNQAADPSLDLPSRRLPPGQQRALAATPGTTAEVTQTNPQALSQILSFYWDRPRSRTLCRLPQSQPQLQSAAARRVIRVMLQVLRVPSVAGRLLHCSLGSFSHCV